MWPPRWRLSVDVDKPSLFGDERQTENSGFALRRAVHWLAANGPSSSFFTSDDVRAEVPEGGLHLRVLWQEWVKRGTKTPSSSLLRRLLEGGQLPAYDTMSPRELSSSPCGSERRRRESSAGPSGLLLGVFEHFLGHICGWFHDLGGLREPFFYAATTSSQDGTEQAE